MEFKSHITRHQQLKAIKKVKKEMDLKNVLTNAPEVFEYYINYCYGLKFEDTPDMSLLIRKFKESLKSYGLENDGEFDWNMGPPKLSSFIQIKPAKKEEQKAEQDEKSEHDPRIATPEEMEEFMKGN